MPGVCPRCLREVYFAEEKLALGKVWHTFCFSCRNCRKLLDSWTVATHSGELYCRNCHNRLFPTTSVRTGLPPLISPIFPPADTGNLAVSPCDSLSDCCCYCYSNDDCALIDARNGEEKFNGSSDSPAAKQRMRGGGGEDEELGASSPLEAGGTKRSSDIEDSQLDAQSFVTTLSDPPLSPAAVTAWYNRHHSASQSTFSRPSSAQRPPIRSSSTPTSGETTVIREANNCHCSGNRRQGNPCRTNHKHHRYSKPCHRHHCHDFQRAATIVGSQEREKFVKDFRGGNFAANYRNHLSPFPKGYPSSAIQSQHKPSNCHQTTKNIITINPPIRKSCYPPLPAHYPPRSLRRRLFFESANECPSGDQTEWYPAMQNIVDDGRNNVDIISFEDSAYEKQPSISEALFSSFPIVDIDNVEDPEDAGICDEDCRMRGGCGGGGGGSGCGCSSVPTRTNVTFDCRGPSPCCKRYQSDRSSTVEGVCGCSGRGRTGCGLSAGGCCSSGGETSAGHSPKTGGCCSDSINEGTCASKCGSGRRPTGFEICPPRPPDPCSSDPSSLSPCNAGACSPPCAARKGCCPPAGCRPVRRRIARCDTPCIGDTQSCGGGGCCGGGCRGGCGKPGQTCLPLKTCTVLPCQPCPRIGGSPCMPPRRCPPQPPCCRSPCLPGTPGSGSGSGGSSCCRSGSPGGRSAGGGGCSPNQGCQQQDDGLGIGSCCQPKLPTGCECLGGGLDCQRCGRKVYQAEMQIASGVPYHNICFSCFCCRKPLETLTYHENCGEIYCKQCYVRNFGPQGYGYAGVLQTPM